ncbi:MAG: aminotransferase class I/II-fold pyridoxal phosphate-dependent enzyme [Nostoc sp.]|uniref:aminotransferase class I/II-fold pyridoxal phosphate-dependent enzyme n=1 Tax=Nostoc sp. TaxID=1180 RepID=UPI002FF51C09
MEQLIINMAIGDRDKPSSSHILQVMHEAIDDAANHNYPLYQGTKEFRETTAKSIESPFGVTGLNPNTEVVSSIGSKEAIYNTFNAQCSNP